MSARIEILNQKTGFQQNPNPIVVDRNMPAILNGRMTQTEWKTFCDNIDQALEPMTPLKNNMFCRMKAAGIGCLAVFPILFLPNLIKEDEDNDDRLNSTPTVAYVVPLFAVALCCIFAFVMFTVRSTMAQINVAGEQVIRVIAAESAKRSDVTFEQGSDVHKMHNTSSGSTGTRIRSVTTSYIKCSVGNESTMEQGYANIATPTVPYAAPVPSAPVSTYDKLSAGLTGTTMTSVGGSATAAQRIQELEAIKNMISPEEYNNKMREIMSSV